MAKTNETVPVDESEYSANAAPRLTTRASHQDTATGALWVHKDLLQVRQDWEIETHIAPAHVDEAFADVASFAAYVKRYTPAGEPPHLTWNSRGLRAVLDYHEAVGVTDRCQWVARLPFEHSAEWKAWTAFANGQAHPQREAVERLEDLAEDIVEPAETDLLLILRSLRANVTAQASTELRPDGTMDVAFSRDERVSGKDTSVSLPGIIRVAVPVLHGDSEKWEIKIRLRVAVGADAKPAFRFSLINADRVLESVYAERVSAAASALGDEFVLLRAAG